MANDGELHALRQHDEHKTTTAFLDKVGIICKVELLKSKEDDIKSGYLTFEQSAKEEDCQNFIDYKNLPDDTESFWLGF